MTEHKPTKDIRQAWLLGGVAVVLVLLFAFVVLPYVDPGKQIEQQAPAFDLPVIAGGEPGNRLRLQDLRGSVVVLDFWASWCGPCKKQMPLLDQVAREYADEDVVFVGVNTDAEPAAAVSFLQTTPVSYVSIFDEGHQASAKYGVTTLPTLVVIDAEGRIVYRDARIVSRRSIAELVDTALASR